VPSQNQAKEAIGNLTALVARVINALLYRSQAETGKSRRWRRSNPICIAQVCHQPISCPWSSAVAQVPAEPVIASCKSRISAEIRSAFIWTGRIRTPGVQLDASSQSASNLCVFILSICGVISCNVWPCSGDIHPSATCFSDSRSQHADHTAYSQTGRQVRS